MAKKKQQPAPAQPERVEIDTGAVLTRDDDGYGALPGVPHDDDMSITTERAEALLEQLAAQGFETGIVSLREDADDGIVNAVEALAELVANDSVTSWVPSEPPSDGGGPWQLVAILYSPLDGLKGNDAVNALAFFARPLETAKPEASFDPDVVQDRAALFLIGNLMAPAKKRFTTLAEPWSRLQQREQERVLDGLADDVRAAVAQAIRAISSNERVSFRAEVESVNFKGATDVKAALKLVSHGEAHALADVAGGFVTVVIEDTSALLDIPEEAVAGDPDNRPLFDDSTAGSALDTKPEEATA